MHDEKLEADEWSDEAERKILRDRLYTDLKWQGGPFVYPAEYPPQRPVGKDEGSEPSLEAWRRGYLVLKAKEEQRLIWAKCLIALAVVMAVLWGVKRLGLL